ncbi:DUF4054 domain-containing protein [Acinetobacter seifertii]|uniref:DUF4054 domain-containing protein n=1 Tax=Acinetobacter seifertii TaxID=1530123 RepID=UPI003AF73397
MLDESTFRQNLPEFADTARYPSSQFNFYLNLGKKLLPEDRWVDFYDEGLTFFIAHYLALFARNAALASVGAAGKVVGNETAKAVDGVSKSMDVSGILYPDAGYWNQTSYGIQFFMLIRIVGAGGFQL